MRAAPSGPNPPWLRPLTERLSPTITALVIASAVMFAFYAVVSPVREFVQWHLALSRQAIIGIEPWQIVTSLFVHLEPIGFLFNMIGLWFIGAAMEREYGRKRFLLILFVPALIANAIMAVAMWRGLARFEPIAGSSLPVLALFVAFGRLYWRTQVRVWGGLVLEARTLTLILVGFSLVADLTRFDLVAFGCDLVVVAVAFGLAGGRGPGIDDLFRGFPGGKPRRKFQVVEGGQRSSEKPSGGNRDRRPGYLN